MVVERTAAVRSWLKKLNSHSLIVPQYSLVCQVAAEHLTEDRMFRAGQLHLTSTLPSQKCPIYIEENPNLRIDPYMGTYFYRINTENEVLKDVKVRKALAYSIDRQLLVDKVTKCGQIPAYSFTPPGTNGYQPTTEIPFDPVLAKSLLDEADF